MLASSCHLQQFSDSLVIKNASLFDIVIWVFGPIVWLGNNFPSDSKQPIIVVIMLVINNHTIENTYTNILSSLV